MHIACTTLMTYYILLIIQLFAAKLNVKFEIRKL